MPVQPTLLFNVFFAMAATAIYGYVGWHLSRRVVSSAETRLAWISFTIWWYGLAVTTLIAGFQDLLGAIGLTNLTLFITAAYINTLAACVSLWGLLYYLLYLFTGNNRSLIPLTIFYITYYVLLVYYITASSPNAVDVGRWSAALVYRAPLEGPFFVLLIALLLAPQIIGGLAYFTLYFHVSDVTQKYRILLVSWSIIVWFASPTIALAGGVAQQDGWQFTSRLIGLVAALTILMAYLPPRWLKERYKIASLNEQNPEG